MIYWMRPRPAPWRKALMAWTVAAGALALMLDVRPAMPETPFDLYRERVAMAALGERCRLFETDIDAALEAAAAQSRTTAVRAGYGAQTLELGAAGVRDEVSHIACNSGRVQQAASRVRDAYRAYSNLRRMAFPGDVGTWQADRSMPQKSASWRLAQDAAAGQDKVVFGVAGVAGAEAVTLSVASPDGTTPYGARLVMRDPARLAEPLLQPSSSPLAARAPLRAAARVILASARTPADPALRPRGFDRAVAFRFPAAAEQDLEQLDPREAVSVEILYPSDRGEVVRTAFLEVGDFDAGLAFLKSQPR